jgi:hypothetical protein
MGDDIGVSVGIRKAGVVSGVSVFSKTHEDRNTANRSMIKRVK